MILFNNLHVPVVSLICEFYFIFDKEGKLNQLSTYSHINVTSLIGIHVFNSSFLCLMNQNIFQPPPFASDIII